MENGRLAPDFSWIELRLSEAGAPANQGGISPHRAAGGHQSPLCARKDRRNRDLLELQPPVWRAFPGDHADQYVWTGRQLSPHAQPCHTDTASALSCGTAVRRGDRTTTRLNSSP